MTLYLFGWRWPDADINRAARRELPMPALARLWGLGRPARVPEAGLAGWRTKLAGLDPLPEAPLLLAASQPEPGYWLRMDPVTLDVQNDGLVLHALPAGSLPAADGAALLDAIARHFAGDGWQCRSVADGWFLRLPQAPAVTFTPLAQVLGRAIGAALPQGADALHWHGLLNEIQMLLYAHPVNDRRSAEGLPLVSGVWLSGGGVWPLPQSPAGLTDGVASSDALLCAIQQAAGLPVTPLPAAFAPPLRCAVLDQALPALQAANPVAWFAAWQALERDWFAPLLAAWQAGTVRSITLIAPELGESRQLAAGSRWCFWRRPALPEVRE
ncbi:hypothetical protein [Chitinilyticum litopenaei]|uniref:hypothetical protein n=1 Tax=Chitinilyticum litopenaei TaxID=1121276 RepID=UPI00118680F8|nr:hypothetical protein [Chitinilyticum litopenaei]